MKESVINCRNSVTRWFDILKTADLLVRNIRSVRAEKTRGPVAAPWQEIHNLSGCTARSNSKDKKKPLCQRGRQKRTKTNKGD